MCRTNDSALLLCSCVNIAGFGVEGSERAVVGMEAMEEVEGSEETCSRRNPGTPPSWPSRRALAAHQPERQYKPSTKKPQAAQWKLEELEGDGGMFGADGRGGAGQVAHSQVYEVCGCPERKLQKSRL